MKDLLILAYADKGYEDFVIPYIYYALKSNREAFVEIILDSSDEFIESNEDVINLLKEFVGSNFLIRQSTISPENCIKNTIRFIEKASEPSKYIYIGDIDILIFDDLLSVHIPLIEKYRLPFSNIIRKVKQPDEPKRLTGLHFCETDKYYPLPDLSDLDLLKENDEHVLYEIMKRKGTMVSDSFLIRPECGIHMSLSRDPLGRYFTKSREVNFAKKSIGWGGDKYHNDYVASLKDSAYLKIQPYLSTKFKYLSLVLEAIAKKEFTQLQRIGMTYGYDKRLITTLTKVDYSELKKERRSLIEGKKFAEALSITKNMLLVWCNDTNLYFDLAWCYLALNDFENAEISFSFIEGMENGKQSLSDSSMYQNFLSRKIG